MKFEKYNIAPEIKKSLEQLGFKRPTDIQFRAIPNILNGEDVMAIAQTGTGKTAAFVIPTIQNLLLLPSDPWGENHIKCLVLVPTHELAAQIADVFQKIALYTHLKTMAIYGGASQEPQIKMIQSGIDILVATPGRMFDLIKQGHCKITKVKVLILDEADRMLEKGFLKDINDVLKFIPKIHQTLFFSATINPEIKDLAYSLVKNPIRIQISPKERISKNIQHTVAFIEMDDKRFFLERIAKDNPEQKIIVFVRTKVRAERVLEAMKRVNVSAVSMHGDKLQNEREQSMAHFTNGKVNMLIATDVSARGIDIANVNIVVNYDLPTEVENYVHRIGRTGRGMNKGNAISFCSTEEKEFLEDIETFLDQTIPVVQISKDTYIETKDISESTNDWRSLIDSKSKKWNSKK